MLAIPGAPSPLVARPGAPSRLGARPGAPSPLGALLGGLLAAAGCAAGPAPAEPVEPPTQAVPDAAVVPAADAARARPAPTPLGPAKPPVPGVKLPRLDAAPPPR